MQSQSRVVFQNLANRLAFVRVASIPHHVHRTAQVLQQVTEKRGGFMLRDMPIAIVMEVQTDPASPRCDRERRDERDLLPLPSRYFQNRCVATRCERSTHQRRNKYATLVDQDAMSAFGVF